ncbi:hypothetical protein AKJ18_21810 [Vibrio xuii]|nr:hypothetical protein AKJ18_21810 [Vibrio xuii]
MPRPIRTRTDEEWATMIRTQRESGLSVAKFCRQNNINQQECFIQQATEKFNGRYDYQYVNYYNNRTPVSIVCPVHGQFEQTPSGHLRSKTGCA